MVQQNDEGDEDCLYGYCKMIKDERGIEPKVRLSVVRRAAIAPMVIDAHANLIIEIFLPV